MVIAYTQQPTNQHTAAAYYLFTYQLTVWDFLQLAPPRNFEQHTAHRWGAGNVLFIVRGARTPPPPPPPPLLALYSSKTLFRLQNSSQRSVR